MPQHFNNLNRRALMEEYGVDENGWNLAVRRLKSLFSHTIEDDIRKQLKAISESHEHKGHMHPGVDQLSDTTACETLPSDGSSVSGKPGDRVRPKTAVTKVDKHDVHPDHSQEIDDWEKYFRDMPTPKKNSVDDLDNILDVIGTYFGEDADYAIDVLEKLVEFYKEQSVLNSFCEEHDISIEQRNAMREQMEYLNLPKVARHDPSVLKRLMKSTAR